MTEKPIKIRKPGLVIPMAVIVGVVIFLFVLGILAAIIFPVLIGFIAVENRARNQAEAVNVMVAIEAYNSDYGSLPNPNGATFKQGGDVVLGIAPGSDPSGPPLPGTANLFQALCGNINSYNNVATNSTITGLNSRNIPYLNSQKGRVDKDGILIASFKSHGLPTYFSIKLDTNGDGVLNGLPDCSLGTFTKTINSPAAVWSSNDQPYTVPNNRWSTTY